jgi:quercetin dioxygenase-like cupin family protein
MNESVSRKELLQANIKDGKKVDKVTIQEVTMNIGIAAPLHLHPSPTMGVIIEGEIIFEIEGQEPQYLKVGDVFYEPANIRIAKFNNSGNIPVKFFVFYLQNKYEEETIRIIV